MRNNADGDEHGGAGEVTGAHQGSSLLQSEATVAGEQTLVPGVAPVSLRERLERRMASPLQPRRLQQPLDIGLFDLAARNQRRMSPADARRWSILRTAS